MCSSFVFGDLERRALGQLSLDEGMPGFAWMSDCSFFLLRRSFFSSAFLFFSISRRRFSIVF